MRCQLFGCLFVALVVTALRPACAEIPSEHRDKADFVVTGVGEGIYVRDHGRYQNHIVELRVEEVAKGRELPAGSTFYVSCFVRKANAPQEPSAGGHKPPPKEGQRIKAFVKDDKGKHPAIYKNWYDELTPAVGK